MEKAMYCRGRVINEFAILEKIIEGYLTSYFIGSSDKRDEFWHIILDRLNFEAKRTSLKTILENKAKKDGFIKTKSNKYPDSKLLEDIRKINEHRIYFAHYALITPNEKTDSIIILMEYRNNMKKITYTSDEFVKLINYISSVRDKIMYMMPVS